MTIQIKDTVPAKSTAGFEVSFFDEDNAAAVPDTIVWTLYNKDRDVVNGREGVTVTPAHTVTITVSGNDNLYTDGQVRIIEVTATYDSSLGQNLPMVDEIVYKIAKSI